MMNEYEHPLFKDRASVVRFSEELMREFAGAETKKEAMEELDAISHKIEQSYNAVAKPRTSSGRYGQIVDYEVVVIWARDVDDKTVASMKSLTHHWLDD